MMDEHPVPATHPGEDLRVPGTHDRAGTRRAPAFTFRFDGTPVIAHPGETVGAALLAAGHRELRRTRLGERPRGLFCAIGTCFDCLVSIDGGSPTRSCLAPAAPGIDVEPDRADD